MLLSAIVDFIFSFSASRLNGADFFFDDDFLSLSLEDLNLEECLLQDERSFAADEEEADSSVEG